MLRQKVIFFCPSLTLFIVAVAIEPEWELPHRGCYLPEWADTRPGSGKFDIVDIDPGLCTYICYAFAGIHGNILVVKPSDELKFQKIITFKTYYPKLKILLSVGGWNLSHQFASMVSSTENRTTFVDSVLNRLRLWGLDGLDVDWEYPPTSMADAYTNLLKDLRGAFESEARMHSRTRLILAAAVASTSRGGYNPLVMARTLDIINLMAYDFHGPSWEPNKTNHNAPLIKSPSDPNHGLNVEALVREWEAVGIPKSSMSIGLALYGRAWSLPQTDNPGVGVTAIGPAPGGAFTEEPGFLAFYEICAAIKSGQLRRHFDRYARVPYATGQNVWVSYDDVESIRQKVLWVRQSGYAGIFVWEMSLDDFRGGCYQSRFPLLQTAKRVLTASETKTPVHVQTPYLYVNVTALSPSLNPALNPALSPSLLPVVHQFSPGQPSQPLSNPVIQKPSNCATFYTVKTGDTAWNIARQHDLSLQDLKQFNPTKSDLEYITQGEKLCVSLPNTHRKGVRVHVVLRGETAWDIANAHGITLADLQQKNPWKTNWDALFPGEEIQT